MHRRHLLLVAVVYLYGCQSAPPKPAATQPLLAPSGSAEPAEYEAVTASALVFDPPVVQDEPPMVLSRAEREPGVAVGYEDQVVEYFSIRTDDRQLHHGFGGGRRGGWGGSYGGGGGSYDRFERRAVSTRVGVRYR